jgi:mRNA-degrading endonuclease YafQ of YafQ-DinJ toxin-antitoxin module
MQKVLAVMSGLENETPLPPSLREHQLTGDCADLLQFTGSIILAISV